MAKLDQILNIAIPTILVLVFIAFIWKKTPLGEWLGPHLSNFWSFLKGEAQDSEIHKQRVITYDS